MASSDDESIFITQSTFQPDILDLNNRPNFEVKNPFFSDISDDELVSATQAAEEHYVYERFAEPMKAMDLQELIKK